METLHEDVDNVEDVEMAGVVAAGSRRSAVVVVHNITTTMIEADVEVHVVDEDLAGKTTTSHSGIVMHLLTSSRTGKCWRRLTSIVLLS